MDHAILRNNNAFLKPNPYVEILVNGKSVRKTDTLKNTNQPRWDQELTILVTATSVLQFRVLDHSSFRKDTLLGEKTIHVAEILQMRDARVDNYKLCLSLTKSPAETSPDAGRGANSASEMFVVIKGLASMNQADAVNGNGVNSSPNVLGNTMNGGAAVRIRSRGTTDEQEDVIMVATASNSPTAAYGSNVSAIQRNSGLDWSGEVNGAGGGGGPDPKLLTQRNIAVQVSEIIQSLFGLINSGILPVLVEIYFHRLCCLCATLVLS